MAIYVPGKLTLAKEFTWNETIWNPSMISTALWLDASDASTITESGGAVSQWDDKSGNARHLSQITAANQPTYLSTGFNSLPTISFDGTGEFLKNASYQPTNAAFTCFLVYNRSATAGTFVLAQKTGGIFELSGGFGGGYTNVTITATGAGNQSSGFNDANPTGTNRILGVQYDGAGTANTDYAARLDGTFQTIINSGALGYQSETGFAIGRRPVQDTSPLNAKISELIYIESQSSLSDQEKIEGYLAHKWGLTANLPSDHPYKTVGPTP